MGNLMKLEFRKLWRHTSFYVLLGITVLLTALSILSAYGLQYILNDPFLSGVPESADVDLGYRGVMFLMSSTQNGSLVTMLAIFISIFICSDYADGTNKFIFSKGYSRTAYYFAKYIVSAVSALIFFLVAAVVSFVPASLIWGVGEGDIGNIAIALLTQAELLIAAVTVFQFVAHGIAKLGGVVAINLFALSILSMIMGILDICRSIADETDSKLFRYFSVTDCLNQISNTSPAWEDIGWGALCALCYIAVFLALGLLVTRKKEV